MRFVPHRMQDLKPLEDCNCVCSLRPKKTTSKQGFWYPFWGNAAKKVTNKQRKKSQLDEPTKKHQKLQVSKNKSHNQARFRQSMSDLPGIHCSCASSVSCPLPPYAAGGKIAPWLWCRGATWRIFCASVCYAVPFARKGICVRQCFVSRSCLTIWSHLAQPLAIKFSNFV